MLVRLSFKITCFLFFDNVPANTEDTQRGGWDNNTHGYNKYMWEVAILVFISALPSSVGKGKVGRLDGWLVGHLLGRLVVLLDGWLWSVGLFVGPVGRFQRMQSE